MNILEELKQLHQMFRDRNTPSEIEARVARLCELAEAEEHARLEAFNVEARPILKCLDVHGDFVSVDDIAKEAGITRGRCEWLCNRLVESKHMLWGNPDRYQIDQKGRDFLYVPSP